MFSQAGAVVCLLQHVQMHESKVQLKVLVPLLLACVRAQAAFQQGRTKDDVREVLNS